MSSRSIKANTGFLLAVFIWLAVASTAMAQKAWEEKIPMRDGVKLATNVYLP